MSKHQYGEPKCVFCIDSDFNYVINHATLNDIFEHPDVKKRKIVTFSVIGAFNKKKRFILDYCLRYLYANYKSINFPDNPLDNSANWMGEENEPLQGFSFSMFDGDISIISIWSDVFLHTVPATGEKIAIVVIDTQGLIYNKTSVAENAQIHSLVASISSQHVFNLINVIQEDQLQCLNLAKYTILDDENEMPFQNLMFLILDWKNTEEFTYGAKGGADYLEELLKMSPKQEREIQSVRRFIKSSFEDLSCTLLPYPGNKVTGSSRENERYDGNWGELDEDFRDELKSLIENLLNPSSLVIKKINGKELTGADLKIYIEHYLKLFQSENLQPALSIYESTVEKQISLIVTECFDHYKETILKTQDLITTEDQIPIFHEMSRNKALVMYKEKKKMGNIEHEKLFQEVLEAQMNKTFKEWSKQLKANIAKIGCKSVSGNYIKIFEFDDDSKPIIFQDNLNFILSHDDVKNCKIVAFSIIGAYRSGKSFFLDYCLRFLYANYKSINFPENRLDNSANWMGEKNEPLEGFSWRSGSNRDTIGIIMWSDVFLHTDPASEEKIAIVVIDTEGLFDTKTTQNGNARIFSLGTLISSIQIFNLMGVIQEDQLQYLQLAVDYAKFTALNQFEEDEEPFQKLMFLIRDWHYIDEHKYGAKGGADYLEELLKIAPKQKEELQSVRRFIKSSFEDLNCTLLPYPGNKVTGSSRENDPYNGNWGEMDEKFKEELKSLIENLLNPNKLILKKINGKELTGEEFKNNIEHCLKLFQSEDLPPALSIYESTVEKQISLVVTECFDHYKETIFKNQGLITTEDQIPIFHEMSRNKALVMYKEKKKMGNAEHEKKFKKQLESSMEKTYQDWSDGSTSSIKLIDEEKKKTEAAIKEREQLAREQLAAEKEAAEILAEIEKLKAEKIIEHERFKNERKMAEMELVAEKEELILKYEREQLKMEKEAAEKITKLEKLNAEEQMEKERFELEVKMFEMKLQAEKDRTACEKITLENESAKNIAALEKNLLSKKFLINQIKTD